MSNVGFASLQIIPSARGFQAALDKGIQPGMAASGKAGGKAFGGGLLAATKSIAAPLAGLFAVSKVTGILKDSIGLASDLEEAGTKLDVVFGKASSKVTSFASAGAKALGLSKVEALDAASSIGVYGRAAGMSDKANADFAANMVKRAVDMASFYNSTPAEALVALQSGLRGETEPLRRFGVMLDDATLRNEALRQGLIKSTKQALTPQQKTLAASAVIMQKSEIAAGDFERTSGGLANQQRILAAQWADMKTRLGGALLPTVNGAVKALNGLFGSVDALVKSPIIGSAKSLFEGFWKSLSSGSGTVGQTFARLREIAEPALRALQETVRSVAANIGPIFQGLAKIVGFLWGLFGPIIVSTVMTTFSGIVKIITGALNIVKGIFEVLGGIFTGDWSKVWGGIKSIVSGAVKVLIGILQVWIVGRATALVRGALGKIGGLFTSLGTKALGAVKSMGSKVVGAFDALGRSAVSLVSKLPGRFGTIGGQIVGGLIRGIRNQAGNLVGTIRRWITDKIPGFVKKALGIKSPSRVMAALGRDTAAGMALGITQGTRGVERAASNLAAIPAHTAASLPVSVGGQGGAAAGGKRQVVVNNYNPIAEPTSVTVSKTLTRLALLEV